MTALDALCNNIPTDGNVRCVEFADGKEPINKELPVDIVRTYARENTVLVAPGRNANLGFTFVIKMTDAWLMPKTDIIMYSKGDAYLRKNGTLRRAAEYDLRNYQ